MMPRAEPITLSALDLLREAACVACRAPSIANSQPWLWRIDNDLLELRCDPRRDGGLGHLQQPGRRRRRTTDVAVPQVQRAVPVRNLPLTADNCSKLAPAMTGTYLAFATATDTRTDWLHSGEAVSAVLLTATPMGIANSVLSEVVEVPGARTPAARPGRTGRLPPADGTTRTKHNRPGTASHTATTPATRW